MCSNKKNAPLPQSATKDYWKGSNLHFLGAGPQPPLSLSTSDTTKYRRSKRSISAALSVVYQCEDSAYLSCADTSPINPR